HAGRPPASSSRTASLPSAISPPDAPQFYRLPPAPRQLMIVSGLGIVLIVGGGIMRVLFAVLAAAALLQDDFLPLVNGKDLSGWEAVGGSIDCWEWRDGRVVCKGGKGGWLCTKDQYGDFELELEYNCPKDGNSGVFIRAPREGHTSKVGMEIQILD